MTTECSASQGSYRSTISWASPKVAMPSRPHTHQPIVKIRRLATTSSDQRLTASVGFLPCWRLLGKGQVDVCRAPLGAALCPADTGNPISTSLHRGHGRVLLAVRSLLAAKKHLADGRWCPPRRLATLHPGTNRPKMVPLQQRLTPMSCPSPSTSGKRMHKPISTTRKTIYSTCTT